MKKLLFRGQLGPGVLLVAFTFGCLGNVAREISAESASLWGNNHTEQPNEPRKQMKG
jgi:hypothetical protein